MHELHTYSPRLDLTFTTSFSSSPESLPLGLTKVLKMPALATPGTIQSTEISGPWASDFKVIPICSAREVASC